jgi:predicted ferric reductase
MQDKQTPCSYERGCLFCGASRMNDSLEVKIREQTMLVELFGEDNGVRREAESG